MPALYLVVPVLCVLAIAYRYYSAFVAAKVMVLDDSRVTPAHEKYDGANYFPVRRWVLFGHHFAAISGAGPLIGPVLAMQFGWAPGLIWLLAGVCLAGAVHDMIMLWASTRSGGRSLAEIARREIGPAAGVTATNPATAPEIAPTTEGFFVRDHSAAIQPSAPLAAAKWVATNALVARPPAESALPALKPNQPTQSKQAPMKLKTRL